MIFVRLLQEAMGEEPLNGHTDLMASLLDSHVKLGKSKLEEVTCVVRYPDGKDHRLDDTVARYSDDNIVLYNFEEKIDPQYFTVAINAKTPEGHEHMRHMLDTIRRHPSYRGRIGNMVLIGVITDEPQCIPCTMKRSKGSV